jgi:hypothetical protein
MAGFFQNLRVASERDDNVDSIGAAYAPAGSPTELTPPVTVANNNIVIQQFPVGFGSYLDGILPTDIATAAGAFAVSMQQIRNLSSIPIEKFAQIVTSIETIAGLSINSTSVPVDRTLVTESLPLIALGSGPFGTYTMSDFFGCMTGLPYIGIDINGLMNTIETPALYNIYKQLYLAVTWERATVSVQYSSYVVESPPTVFTTYYTVTGLTLVDPGGGYGREGGSAPAITISNGGSGTTTIGTDDTNITNFGRVTTVTLASAGTDGTSIPTATVAFPPGTGAFSNSIVQAYIDAANAEILAIQTANQRLSEQLNTNWNYTGTQLTIEQRALDTGLSIPVPPVEVVPDAAPFPTTQIAFTDAVPQFALNTDPHMEAQTIEAIANICSPGGQSVVGMMREARNQARLTEVGIPLDNNIPATITPVQNKELVANGTVANSPPATLGQVDCTTGDEINPDPYGVYDPTDNNYYVTNPAFGGSNVVPAIADGSNVVPAIAGGTIGASEFFGISSALDTGNAEALGSFAGSAYTNLIPTNLNAIYTSKNLLPSTYTIGEAIDEVIRCNCDCWDLV